MEQKLKQTIAELLEELAHVNSQLEREKAKNLEEIAHVNSQLRRERAKNLELITANAALVADKPRSKVVAIVQPSASKSLTHPVPPIASSKTTTSQPKTVIPVPKKQTVQVPKPQPPVIPVSSPKPQTPLRRECFVNPNNRTPANLKSPYGVRVVSPPTVKSTGIPKDQTSKVISVINTQMKNQTPKTPPVTIPKKSVPKKSPPKIVAVYAGRTLPSNITLNEEGIPIGSKGNNVAHWAFPLEDFEKFSNLTDAEHEDLLVKVRNEIVKTNKAKNQGKTLTFFGQDTEEKLGFLYQNKAFLESLKPSPSPSKGGGRGRGNYRKRGG